MALPIVTRQRWLLTLAAALVVGAGSGCQLPHEADYAKEARFISCRGTNFQIVAWAWDRNNPQPCPLVIHLPEGDSSYKELADRKFLVAHGWTIKETDNGLTETSYRRGNLVAWACHRGGILDLAGVNALTCPEPQEGIVSIGGKRFTLPVSDDEMVRFFGEPIRRR